MSTKRALELFLLFLLIASVPLTMYLVQRPQQVEKQASVVPTVFTIDVAKAKPLPRMWQHLAQGGEVPIPQLPSVIKEVSALSPRYIRIDHIFDAYQLVKRASDGKLFFDFTLLDREVDAIVEMGATPFFSLSYIPADIQDPQHSDRPLYTLWKELVQALVLHYSGRQGKSLTYVFYEVYNEPDLFGKWSISEYIQLYEASLRGAESASNTQTFFFGGPAISFFDSSFIRTFLATLQERKLRLDFVSWHVYDPSPSKIANDAQTLSLLMRDTPSYAKALKIVSEWGPFPEKNVWYENIFGAAHLVATVTRAFDAIDMLFPFEIKDGRAIDEGASSGWGILRNEESWFAKKPRYFALSLLSRLGSLTFDVQGVDERLYAIASGSNPLDLTIILTNYTFGRGSTLLPIETRLIHQLPGTYRIRKTVLTNDGLQSEVEGELFPVSKDELVFPLELFADDIVAMDIDRVSGAVAHTLGESGDPSDKAAEISSRTPSVAYIIPPQTQTNVIEVSFSLRTDVPLHQILDTTLFESETASISIRLLKETQGFSNVLTLHVANSGAISTVSLPLSPSELQAWHHFKLTFDNKRALLTFSFDETVKEAPLHSSVNLDERITFGGFAGAIDNVVVSIDGKQLLKDSF